MPSGESGAASGLVNGHCGTVSRGQGAGGEEEEEQLPW